MTGAWILVGVGWACFFTMVALLAIGSTALAWAVGGVAVALFVAARFTGRRATR